MFGGIIRLLVFFYKSDNCDVFVEELNIEKYEVLYFEVLYCFMNYIKNLL